MHKGELQSESRTEKEKRRNESMPPGHRRRYRRRRLLLGLHARREHGAAGGRPAGNGTVVTYLG